MVVVLSYQDDRGSRKWKSQVVKDEIIQVSFYTPPWMLFVVMLMKCQFECLFRF